jgi:hypothetical protein
MMTDTGLDAAKVIEFSDNWPDIGLITSSLGEGPAVTLI